MDRPADFICSAKIAELWGGEESERTARNEWVETWRPITPTPGPPPTGPPPMSAHPLCSDSDDTAKTDIVRAGSAI